ncbi:MAG: hypothetical protein IJ281_00685 [Clostridia bacterium]|nr:hypothetical protein [Clostridia bacterium]
MSERAVNYHLDAHDTGVLYSTMSKAISSVRCEESLDNAAWREEADQDMQRKRGKSKV